MSIIGITTDFGNQGYFVPSMKGVILSINPEAKIVDITHQIPKHDIEKGDFVLANAVKTFPKNSTFLTVIDPGVGTERDCILIKTKNGFNFVGPDNGVFTTVTDSYGIEEIRKIDNEKVMRDKTSNTFHGRDVMAPVAARLSKGINPSEMGPQIEEITKLDSIRPKIKDNKVQGKILNIDDFGNLVTNIRRGDMPKGVKRGKTLEIEIGEHKFDATFQTAFGNVRRGKKLCYMGSAGLLEIAKNLGDLAEELGLKKSERFDIKIKF